MHEERVEPLGVGAEPVAHPSDAVADVDVVITATPLGENRSGVAGPTVVADRALLLPIDFDASVPAETVRSADAFFVDDVDQFEYYRRLGLFDAWPEASASVGEVLGSRSNSSGRVVCCNLGLAALDAAFAQVIVAGACDKGLDVTVIV